MYSNILVNECKQEISVNSAQAFSPVPSPVLALDRSVITSHQGAVNPDVIEVQGDSHNGCYGSLFMRLYCAGCGKFRDVNIYCSDRTCPYCRGRLHNRLMARYGPLINQVPREKMALITLTLRIGSGDLSLRVKKIRVAWRKLIRQQLFLSAVSGGLYTIEIKPAIAGGAARAWNVHIHALVEVKENLRLWELNGKRKADIILPGGGLLTWQGLGRAWAQLTGGSYVVDIMPVYGRVDSGLKYVLKYMLKSPAMDADQRSAYNRALKKTRLVNTFGAWCPQSINYRFHEKKDIHVLTCDQCGGDQWMAEFEVMQALRSYRREILRL